VSLHVKSKYYSTLSSVIVAHTQQKVIAFNHLMECALFIKGNSQMYNENSSIQQTQIKVPWEQPLDILQEEIVPT
jgi:hypothetical protein